MSKRASLTLRKPGQRPDPRAIEAFIASGDQENADKVSTPSLKPVPAPEPTPEPIQKTADTAEVDPHNTSAEVDVPTFRRATRSIAKRKTKPDRRRTTVYMDMSLARRLAAHCAAKDVDMSDAVNTALRAYLA